MYEISFRPATAEDAETLYRVKAAAFADEFELFKYAEADGIFRKIVEDSKCAEPKEDMFSMDWHRQMCSMGDKTTVICDGVKTIGSAVVFPKEISGYFAGDYPGCDFSKNDVNILLCVYVLPEYKNRGIGRKAMDYAERLLPSGKWVLNTPDVSAKNRRFYEKCGYTAYGTCGPNNILRIYAKGF